MRQAAIRWEIRRRLRKMIIHLREDAPIFVAQYPQGAEAPIFSSALVKNIEHCDNHRPGWGQNLCLHFTLPLVAYSY